MGKHKIYFGDSRELHPQKSTCHLVVTSPPYWDLKDYGNDNQIGLGQSYSGYLDSMATVFSNCYDSLYEGCKMCVNIGDYFVKSVDSTGGVSSVVPLGSSFTLMCIKLGFTYCGDTLWLKVANQSLAGGGTWGGSIYYPRDGTIFQRYEHILIFRKPGAPPQVSQDIKELSELSYDERSTWFNGDWSISGASQKGHPAVFPVEIPRRLIKMFSMYGETVYDPFMGSGTTSEACMVTGRNSIGCELNKEYKSFMQERFAKYEKEKVKYFNV